MSQRGFLLYVGKKMVCLHEYGLAVSNELKLLLST